MTKSELIDRLADVQQHLAHVDVELGVKSILEQMSSSLSMGERIEIRGLEAFLCITVRPGWDATPKPVTPLPYPASTYRISSLESHFVKG